MWPGGEARGERARGSVARASSSDVAVGGLYERFFRQKALKWLVLDNRPQPAEPPRRSAHVLKREETYNSLRAITMSVYRVVLRAWHGEWNGVRLWTRERFFDETKKERRRGRSATRPRGETGERFRFRLRVSSPRPGKKNLHEKKPTETSSSPQTSKEDKPALVLNWASRRIWQDNSEVRALRMVFLRNALL